MSRKQKNTSRYVYAGVALVMVVLMAFAGIAPALRKDDTSDADDTEFEFPQPTFEFPDPPEGTPDLPFDVLFTHPSGYFELVPPLGWAYQDASSGDIFGAAWMSVSQHGVVHVFVKRFDEDVDKDQFIEFIESEYPSGFSRYEDYMVTSRDYDGDPVVVEFEAVFEDLTYKAREWAGFEGNIVWALRIVAPENYPALLDYLGEQVLPTYKVYPDAGAEAETD